MNEKDKEAIAAKGITEAAITTQLNRFEEGFPFLKIEAVATIGNAKHLSDRYPYRMIRTRWSGKLGTQFAATVKVVGHDDIGIVANITSLINKEGDTALRNITINSHSGLFEGHLVIGVSSIATLDQLIKKIKSLKGVKGVERVQY